MSNAPRKRKQSGTRARVASTASTSAVSTSTIARAAVGLLAIVALVIIAVIAFGADDAERPDDLAFNGEPLPEFVAGETDPAIGMKAPIFVTEYLDGEYAFIGGGGGPNDTAKLVVFVAHWCPTCQAEVPEIAEWVAENDLPDNVEIVMVSSFADADRDNHPPSAWFEETGWDAPVAVDSSDGEIAREFGFTSVPSWAVLTNLNFVLDRGVGPLEPDDLERAISLASVGA